MGDKPARGWLGRIGPGIITAAVVLGPGSILSVSKVGADFGYSQIWLLISAVAFMIVFATIAARFGCVSERSLLETVAVHFGRWLAVVLGISAWLVVAGFQFGNNMGVLTGMEELVPAFPGWVWPVAFTLGSIAFLFAAKNLYGILEKLMLVLVGVMILAFAATLFTTGIDVAEAAKGLIPSVPAGGFGSAKAMMATTFSIVAAFYLAYLVQEKKWGAAEYREGIRDSWIGIALLGLMTLTIMLCAAKAFGGKNVTLKSAVDVARQLEQGPFGAWARIVFCCGLVAASFSSFIVNSLIGGGLLADGLGGGGKFDNPRVKVGASAALLVGMTVALVALKYEQSRVASVVIAQSMTLLLTPLCGIVLLVLANMKSVMGDRRNGIALNLLAAAGLLVVLWMTWTTAQSLYERFTAI